MNSIAPIDDEKLAQVRAARYWWPELFMEPTPERMAKVAAEAAIRAQRIKRYVNAHGGML